MQGVTLMILAANSAVKAFRAISTKRLMSSISETHLLEQNAPETPEPLVKKWIQEARDEELPLPTVASLASALMPSGRVSNRMVNVSEFNSSGNFVLYSDFSDSRKGRDVASNAQVALTFYWQQLNRSIRVEGTLNVMPQSEARPYFQGRSQEFQASVVLGPQSKPVEGLDPLVERLEILLKEKLDIPDYWTGAVIEPSWIEFWQGNKDRVSDRLEYSRQNGTWARQRLSP